MKKTIQIFAVLLMLALSATAIADASVEYVGREEIFVFKPGSVYQVTDLFEDFKNVVPGDVLSQKITVKNGSHSDIRIYMQATPETWVETEQEDFLDHLRLKVTSGSTLFEAAASESAQLTEPTFIGFLSEEPPGEIDLWVTLEVPIELGSEYMGQIGVVPWTFLVEEIPDDDSPHTGDWYENTVWLALAGVLVLAIIAVVVLMRRRRAAN